MSGLTDVIYGCTVMTYGPCQRCPKGRTSEPRSGAAAAIRSIARSGRAISPRLLHFPAASIPLRAAGSAFEGAGSGERIQAGIYGKASARFDSARTVVRICQKNVDQRSRDSSAASVSATRGRSWLSRNQPRRIAFNWSIVLIACRQKSWLGYITCSCPIGGGLSELRPPTIQRLWR
jgi:hypothetical protein